MIPAAIVDPVLNDLVGSRARRHRHRRGNSYYKDDILRAERLKAKKLHYVDVGTSGGVWGSSAATADDRRRDAGRRGTRPIFATLAPGREHPRSPLGAKRSAARRARLLHLRTHGRGPLRQDGAYGIEYGLMAAYAEGLNILAGRHRKHTTSRRRDRSAAEPARFQYTQPRRRHRSLAAGSVISSWLLDLTAMAFAKDPSSRATPAACPTRARVAGRSRRRRGGRARALLSSAFTAFYSRDLDEFANKILSHAQGVRRSRRKKS